MVEAVSFRDGRFEWMEVGIYVNLRSVLEVSEVDVDFSPLDCDGTGALHPCRRTFIGTKAQENTASGTCTGIIVRLPGQAGEPSKFRCLRPLLGCELHPQQLNGNKCK